MNRVLVIVPAYNEEASIVNVIKNINETTNNIDILIVNDASKDNTKEMAESTSAKVINLPFNLGIGGAMQTGYMYAYKNNYDIAIQIDADGQHNPVYINKMLKTLKDNDMVIGSRYLEKTKYKSKFFRKLGVIFFSWITAVFTGRKFTDTTSGYRMINKKIIKYFAFNYPTDYPEVEVLIRLCKKRIRISEISMEMEERKTGKSFVTPIKSLYYMIKVTLGIIISFIREEKYYYY